METEAAEQLEAGMDEAAEPSLETEKPEAADEAVLAASEPEVQQSGKQPDAVIRMTDSLQKRLPETRSIT